MKRNQCCLCGILGIVQFGSMTSSDTSLEGQALLSLCYIDKNKITGMPSSSLIMAMNQCRGWEWGPALSWLELWAELIWEEGGGGEALLGSPSCFPSKVLAWRLQKTLAMSSINTTARTQPKDQIFYSKKLRITVSFSHGSISHTLGLYTLGVWFHSHE